MASKWCCVSLGAATVDITGVRAVGAFPANSVRRVPGTTNESLPGSDRRFVLGELGPRTNNEDDFPSARHCKRSRSYATIIRTAGQCVPLSSTIRIDRKVSAGIASRKGRNKSGRRFCCESSVCKVPMDKSVKCLAAARPDHAELGSPVRRRSQ